jgi:GntR family transcriptional regulator/MocR family aminotransferase
MFSHSPLLDQAVLCDFIEQGHFGRHLRRMRKTYGERLAVLLECGRMYLGEYLELSNIEAGVQTIGLLRNNTSAETVAKRAAMENIDVVPLSRYCCSTAIAEGLQIGFAAVHEKEIRDGVLKLACIFQALNSKSAKNGGR